VLSPTIFIRIGVVIDASNHATKDDLVDGDWYKEN